MSHGCILLPMFETKLSPQLLEKWELVLADIPEDEIDLDLFFTFLNRLSKEAGEREALTQTLTQIIVVPVGVEMKAGSQRTPIQVTASEYQLLLLCSVRHNHRQIQVVVFYKADHGSPNCQLFNGKSVDER